MSDLAILFKLCSIIKSFMKLATKKYFIIWKLDAV